MPEVTDIALIVGCAVIWIASTIYKPAWKYGFGHITTFVHELGHAITGFFTGRGVAGIKLHFDGSGETRDSGRRSWIPGGRFLSLVMGYPAPILLGAFLLGAAAGEYINLSMKLMLFFGIFTLLFTRNLWGLVVVLVWIGFSFVASTYLYDSYISNVLITIAGTFFIVGGIKDLLLLLRQYRHGLAPQTDLGIMRRETWIPMWLTFAVILVISFPGAWLLYRFSATVLERLPFLTAIT